MGTETPADGQSQATDHQAQEQRLAAALRDLLHQVDIGDYRDHLGRSLSDSQALLRAQAVVDQFGITHEHLCKTLEACDLEGDLRDAARRIIALSPASPSDSPPEYDTWHTGP
jgi:hypothetical protein